MLLKLKKYKFIFSIFLMSLYVFIATPVSFWHQHAGFEKRIQNKSTGKAIASFKLNPANQSDTDGDCSVCSHQYSAFIDDAVLSFTLIPSSLNTPEGCHILSFHDIPSIPQFNKGPPFFFSV
jgi:hypothetical protein